MNDSILEFKDVWKSFGEGKTKIDALKGINLEIKDNSLNLILGPSGCGKTTLLNLASLLDCPSKGKIQIKGENIEDISKRSKIRRSEIGIVYQRDNLFSYLNILENVMVPMIKKDKEKAVEMLKVVGFNDLKLFSDEISTEDQQNAALARAIINEPSLLLADEPTGELDSKSTHNFMNLMKDIAINCAILMVSNNPDLAKYCDKVFYLKDGVISKKRIV